MKKIFSLLSVFVLGAGFVGAVDMSDYVVLHEYCDASAHGAISCPGKYSGLLSQLDSKIDGFLLQFVDGQLMYHGGNALAVADELEGLRQRVAAASVTTFDEKVLFIVEVLYYKISVQIEQLLQGPVVDERPVEDELEQLLEELFQ